MIRNFQFLMMHKNVNGNARNFNAFHPDFLLKKCNLMFKLQFYNKILSHNGLQVVIFS